MWLLTALVGVISVIVYVVLMLALYISPLMIKSACIVENSDLPTKPLLLAHKGASAVRYDSVLFVHTERKHYMVYYAQTSIGRWHYEMKLENRKA